MTEATEFRPIEKLREAAKLPQDVFKPLNRFMLTMYRLGFGPALSRTSKIMILHHTGRKSGLLRQTPVNFARSNGDVYCMAGFGKIAHWYRNIQAAPQVEVWLGDERWKGQAETVTDPDEAVLPMKQVLINSGPAGWAVLGKNPAAITADSLREAVHEFPLVRIHLEERVVGEGGPGDLAWVTGIVAAVLGLWLLRQMFRRKV